MNLAEKNDVESVSYPSRGRSVKADLAKPAGSPPWPAVILIHEISGTDDHYKDLAGRFAREGYLALVPDLYCNDEVYQSIDHHAIHMMGRVRHAHDLDAAIAALDLPERDAHELKRAALWDRERDLSTYVPDLVAGIDYLRSQPDVWNDAIGAVGFCWGGGVLGQLLVAGAKLDAAEIYYGEPPELDKLSAVQCPVEGHYGTADTVVGYKFAPDLGAAMKSAGKDFAFYIYDDAPHAFFNDTGPRYRPEAAKLAWERTLSFFGKQLKGASITR